MLQKILTSKQDTSFFTVIDQLSEEAEKNGLTIQKMAELMEWDEETVKNLFGEDHNIDA